MAVSAPNLKSLFPAFAATDDARIELFFDIAKQSMSEPFWGSLYDTGVYYLTAHLIAMADRGASGAAGPVTSEKVGDLARGYASPIKAGWFDDLMATPYGTGFKRLRSQIPITPLVAGD